MAEVADYTEVLRQRAEAKAAERRARRLKTVYKVGQEVIVVNPQRFVRVGYPLGIAEARKHMEETLGPDVRMLFGKLGAEVYEPDRPLDMLLTHTVNMTDKAYDQVVSALGYAWLRLKGFGGSARTIHTTPQESWRGKRFHVEAKRVVRTGIRKPGSTSYGYDGIPDNEPPYLSKVKSHVLLRLFPVDAFSFQWNEDGGEMWIEEANVCPAAPDSVSACGNDLTSEPRCV